MQRDLMKTDDGKLDFSRLDPIWCPMVRRFRFSSSMYGHMDFSQDHSEQPTQATQRQRQQRRRMEVGEEKRPTNVHQEGNVTKYSKVDEILKQINEAYEESGERPIPFYKLIIDPTNMIYTFDNSFQISFLFRDGFLSFEKGSDGNPAVRPVKRRKDVEPSGDMASAAVALNQTIIDVSFCN